MSKTFKSMSTYKVITVAAERNVPGFFLEIQPSDGDSETISLASSEAPALALAILEAAGVKATRRPPNFIAGSDYQLENAAYEIDEYIRAREITAAAEADRVKLEAEALKLCNEFYSESATSWKEARISAGQKESWLAVARAARELNKETGQ